MKLCLEAECRVLQGRSLDRRPSGGQAFLRRHFCGTFIGGAHSPGHPSLESTSTHEGRLRTADPNPGLQALGGAVGPLSAMRRIRVGPGTAPQQLLPSMGFMACQQ
ncbi:hypothetical protein ACOMHN_008188 [Nucella lapillus]